MTVDRRVMRTRTALYDALVALIREKNYSAITVEDVLTRANIGRSTFYAHFKSKDDLLERSLERLRALLLAATEASSQNPTGRDAARALFEHVADYADVQAALAGTRGGAVVGKAIEEVIAGYLRNALPPQAANDPIPRELRVRHIVATFETVLRWWGECRRRPIGPEEADRHFRRLLLNGLPASTCEPFIMIDPGSVPRQQAEEKGCLVSQSYGDSGLAESVD